MKGGYAVVKFVDKDVVKIAPFDLVRNQDGSKFAPKTAMDLPAENVKVKWQLSLTSGSFSHDGYYEAEVLAIASSIASATSKAKSLGVRLPPCLVLTLPARPSLPNPNASKSGDKRTRRNDTPKPGKTQMRTGKKFAGGNENSKGTSISQIVVDDSLPDDEDDDDDDDDGVVTKKPKLNPVRKDKVKLRRLLNAEGLISSNPLMAAICGHGDKKPSGNELQKHESNDIKIERDDKRELKDTISEIVAFDEEPKEENVKANEPEKDNDKSKSVSDPDSNISCEEIDLNTDLITQTEKNAAISSSSSESDSGEERDNKQGDEEDLDVTLPVAQVDLEDEESSDTDETHESKSDPDDDTGILLEDNEALKKSVTSLKNELAETKRQLVVCNNVRLEQKDQFQKEKLRLEAEISSLKTRVEKLVNRNDCLQDTLAAMNKESHGTKDHKLKSPAGSEQAPRSSKSSKRASEDSSKDPRDSGNKVFKSSSHDSSKEKLHKSASSSKEKHHRSSSLNSKEKDHRSSSCEKKEKSMKTLSYGSEEETFKTSIDDEMNDFLNSGGKDKSDNEGSSSDVEQIKPTPSNALESKKKGKKDALNYKDPYLEETCQKVLDHLKGEAELPLDKSGKMIVGKLRVSKKLFENNFKTNKLDMVKAARNLTAMAWSEGERVDRSLTGRPNNRHVGEPKLKATPKKVLSILGSLKAHAMYCGDKDGPGLTALMKSCEKAIGSKLSTDAQAAKRAKPS